VNRALVAEQLREEVLHAVADRYGPVLRLTPGPLGLGLRRPPSPLDLVSSRLGATDHSRADSLGCLFDTPADLLGAAFDLLRTRPGVGLIRRKCRRID